MRHFLASPFFVIAFLAIFMISIILGRDECERIISDFEKRK